MSFLAYLWGSDPARSLKHAKEEVQRHIGLFERTARLTFREHQVLQSVGEELSVQPLSELMHSSGAKEDCGVEFPVNTVTMFRKYAFLGRDDNLKDMKEALDPTFATDKAASTKGISMQPKYGQDVACCILQGLGGIGKTQTALEYTFRYRENYDAIFWVSAEMGTSIALAYVAMSRTLGLTTLHTEEGEGQKHAIEIVKKWLGKTSMNTLM